MQPSRHSSRQSNSQPDMRSRLHRYQLVLRRYWWLALLIVSGALAIQGWLIFKAPPTYISQARMWVSGKVAIAEGALFREEMVNFLGTQSEVMRSDLLKQRTLNRLRLMDPKAEQCEVALRITVVPRTVVLVLQVTGADPEFVKKFLQAHLNEFLLYKKELRQNAADEVVSALTQQLYKPREELKTAEEALQKFTAANNVVFLQEQGSSAGSFLAKLNIKLADLRMESQLLELVLSDSASANAPKQPGSGEDNQQFVGFIKAREQLLMLKAEREDLARYLKPLHPKLRKLDDEVARAERTLDIFKQQTADQLAVKRNSLRLVIANHEESVKEWDTKATESNRKMAEYETLKRNTARLQSLLERLDSTTQNVGVSRNLEQEQLAILENATPAFVAPTGAARRLVVAGVFGLFAAMLLLHLVERSDDRVNFVTDIDNLFSVQAVGQVPQIRGAKGRLGLVHPNDLRHNFVESFRDIRSALLFSTAGGGRPHTILVTSAVPNEGKSSVSSNLAVTLALSGARTLLVDADLRCGVMHEVFGGSSEPGLHEILTGGVAWQEALRSTNTPNLSLISRGKNTQLGGELFLSAALPAFLAQIRDEFDFVVIDSAPVMATADTPTLAPKVDGVLFVIRSRYTSSRLCRAALEQLGQRNVPILGIVLNRADESLPTYYNYKYSKYYHSGGGKKAIAAPAVEATAGTRD